MSASGSYRFVYAYVHGFGASNRSYKGSFLQKHFESNLGTEFFCFDCNVPSFAELTYTNALKVISDKDAELRLIHGDFKWRLIGSSMGGYLSARWAELNPDRVDSLFLLCPAFDLPGRWAARLGPIGIENWREHGKHAFPFFPLKQDVNVHYELYRDAKENHPVFPRAAVKTFIVHGEQDEIIPFSSSKTWKAQNRAADIQIHAVQDGHELTQSLPIIVDTIESFFELKKL